MKATAYLLACVAVLGGCAGDPAAPEATPSLKVGENAAEQQGLAAARAATAKFQRFDVAEANNYTYLFMDMCMVDQSPEALGGMGYHYVNTELLDGTVDVTRPEALLYEPGTNGQLKLVAVEYVIPASEWQSEDPPMLLGQQLTLNGFGLWALHVWLWKNNPAGMYASWNPSVNCNNAAAASALAR